MVIHSTFSDFVLFLYIHLSNADSHYDPTELLVIKAKMTSLYEEDINFEKKLYQTIREYNAFDKTKLNKLFRDSFMYFKPNKVKSKLLTDLHEIVNADGNVSPSENKALESLKEIIDLIN